MDKAPVFLPSLREPRWADYVCRLSAYNLTKPPSVKSHSHLIFRNESWQTGQYLMFNYSSIEWYKCVMFFIESFLVEPGFNEWPTKSCCVFWPSVADNTRVHAQGPGIVCACTSPFWKKNGRLKYAIASARFRHDYLGIKTLTFQSSSFPKLIS